MAKANETIEVIEKELAISIPNEVLTLMLKERIAHDLKGLVLDEAEADGERLSLVFRRIDY